LFQFYGVEGVDVERIFSFLEAVLDLFIDVIDA
jgi:hypothetical protein